MRPLALHLLDEAQTAYAKKRLLQALKNYGWRLGTGFLSTPLILDVLAETDLEAAYRLLENEQMPGWLFMPKSGATTIWESWEGDRAAGSGVASLDHYSKGAVCRWLFDTMRYPGERGELLFHCAASRRTLYPCKGRLQQRVRPGGKRLGEDGERMELYRDDPCKLHCRIDAARERAGAADCRNLHILR